MTDILVGTSVDSSRSDDNDGRAAVRYQWVEKDCPVEGTVVLPRFHRAHLSSIDIEHEPLLAPRGAVLFAALEVSSHLPSRRRRTGT